MMYSWNNVGLDIIPGSNPRKLIQAWEAEAGVQQVPSQVQMRSGHVLSIFLHPYYLTLSV